MPYEIKIDEVLKIIFGRYFFWWMDCNRTTCIIINAVRNNFRIFIINIYAFLNNYFIVILIIFIFVRQIFIIFNDSKLINIQACIIVWNCQLTESWPSDALTAPIAKIARKSMLTSIILLNFIILSPIMHVKYWIFYISNIIWNNLCKKINISQLKQLLSLKVCWLKNKKKWSNCRSNYFLIFAVFLTVSFRYVAW